MKRIVCTAALAVLLGGCMVGPDFHPPAAPGPSAGYTPAPLPARTADAATPGLAGGGVQAFAPGAELPQAWWTLYRNPALSALVAEALKANPDLEAARATLKAAQAEVRAQRAGLFPTAAITGQASREKDSATLSPTLNAPQTLFSLYNIQLAIAYAPDVFGGARRGLENAQALAEQQRDELDASRLAITSNVVNTAIQQAGAEAQVEALERLVAIDRSLLDLYRRERTLGQLAQADVSAQEALLAEAEADLEPLRRQLAQDADLLAALTGRTPAEYRAPTFRLAELSLPATLPVSLPSALVAQRPDIRAAEANLHAASAAVGVAVAARLPQITLSATGGGASTAIGSVLSNPATFWNLAGGFAQPVFQGFQLLARQRQAEAQYEAARAQYRSTVLAAFQNVGDALQAAEIDARSLRSLAAAEQATAGTLAIARGQERLGQISGAQVLVVEQSYRIALQAEVQAQAQRFSDTAALFQALGGGWWSRGESNP